MSFGGNLDLPMSRLISLLCQRISTFGRMRDPAELLWQMFVEKKTKCLVIL